MHAAMQVVPSRDSNLEGVCKPLRKPRRKRDAGPLEGPDSVTAVPGPRDDFMNDKRRDARRFAPCPRLRRRRRVVVVVVVLVPRRPGYPPRTAAWRANRGKGKGARMRASTGSPVRGRQPNRRARRPACLRRGARALPCLALCLRGCSSAVLRVRRVLQL